MRVALLCAGVSMLGCGAFNPAFLNLIDSQGTGQFSTIENAPGHVVISFINNAEVDEQLIRYLESPDGGSLVFTDLEKRALRPRIRFRVRITFTSGAFMDVEFVDGSSTLVDPTFDTRSDPDLNQNDLNNVVVICDVQRVEVLPTSPIEVFIPVPLQEYQQRQVTTNDVTFFQFVLNQTFPPQFRPLLVDDVDENNNIVLRRNIDIRKAPATVEPTFCGSVVTITAGGSLAVPFLEGFPDPSYDVGDVQTTAGIGGRFSLIVRVQ